MASILIALLFLFSFPQEQIEHTYKKQLTSAWETFYQGQYEQAKTAALLAQSISPDEPGGYELYSIISLFQLRQRLGIEGFQQKKTNIASCPDCSLLLADFERHERQGLELVRHLLAKNYRNREAHYFLARLNLNRVWLNFQVLGKKRGWKEFQEAKKSLAIVLSQKPNHTRTLTALACINFVLAEQNIIARLFLGWGSKEKAFADLGVAISCSSCSEADVFEAKFVLLDFLWREKRYPECNILASELHRRFPENQSLLKYIKHRP